MKQQEKAKELLDSFYWELEDDYKSKICALIAVDEILKCNPCNIVNGGLVSTKEYWKEVKNEITNQK